jgi:hypothetical protein
MVQTSFRWRDDDGSETAASWLELKNIDHTITMGSGNVNIRIRIEMEETAGNVWANFEEELYISKNGAAYVVLPATSSGFGIQYGISSYFADQDETTQQIGSGTYVTGLNQGMAENGVGGGAGEPDYGGSDTCEFEIVMELVDADLSDADYFDFEYWENGSTTNITFTEIPRLTISKAAAAGPVAGSLAMMGAGR